MATRAQVAAQVQRIQQLANDYGNALDAAVATMGNAVWQGPAATDFYSELTGRRGTVRNSLETALNDARRVLANVPPDRPATPPSPVPMSGRPY